MIWGGFSASGLNTVVRIQGKLNAQAYIELLNEHLLPLELPDNGVQFQQDNALPHRSSQTIEWLAENGIDVMPWPPQSPDLNPIENVWGYLRARLEHREIRNMEDLWTAVQDEWAELPADQLTLLNDSMPDRIRAVISANGGHTTY